MKKVWMIGACLCFMSAVATFPQEPAPSSAPPSAAALATIFGQPADTGCPAPQGGVDLPGQHPGINLTCSAVATCNDTSGVNVTCNYAGSGGTCSFVNQNCAAGIRGQVNCNGTVTQCPECCTNGTKRYTQLATCCYNEEVGRCRRKLKEETCSNGSWQVTGFPCDGLNCSGSCPM